MSLMDEIEKFLTDVEQYAPSTISKNSLKLVENLKGKLDMLTENISRFEDVSFISRDIRGMEHETDLIGRILPEVYEKHFQKKAGVSWNGQSVSGPFVDFSSAVAQAIALEINGDFIKNAINAARSYAR